MDVHNLFVFVGPSFRSLTWCVSVAGLYLCTVTIGVEHAEVADE